VKDAPVNSVVFFLEQQLSFFSRILLGKVYQSYRRNPKKAELCCQQEVAAPLLTPTLPTATVYLLDQGNRKIPSGRASPGATYQTLT
jgi:hypothetical protein